MSDQPTPTIPFRDGPLLVGVSDHTCTRCAGFRYVQVTPRWYACPECRGSGRSDITGDMDPARCVRDSSQPDHEDRAAIAARLIGELNERRRVASAHRQRGGHS